MKLSVITINLNNSVGLNKTIESVLLQDFTDFEYIIIDGASNDGSIDIIHSYADSKTYNNSITYWVSESDSGIYNAMNKGIKIAKGEYILFLNSGDFLVNPEVLARVFQLGFNQDIAVGNCNISKNGEVVFIATPPNEISLASFRGKTIPHQSAFIKKDILLKFGMYSENFRIHADLEFFIKTIIIGNCTYLKIPIIISDYNLAGISGNPSFSAISEAEKKTIFESLVPERVLLDYSMWESERRDIEALIWVNSKPSLNFLLKRIFRFSTFAATFRKKIFANSMI
jgi:glycosyltransferase involved in cell wall biosynthesis